MCPGTVGSVDKDKYSGQQLDLQHCRICQLERVYVHWYGRLC